MWLLQYAAAPRVVESGRMNTMYLLEQTSEHLPVLVCRPVQLWTLEASLSMPGGQG